MFTESGPSLRPNSNEIFYSCDKTGTATHDFVLRARRSLNYVGDLMPGVWNDPIFLGRLEELLNHQIDVQIISSTIDLSNEPFKSSPLMDLFNRFPMVKLFNSPQEQPIHFGITDQDNVLIEEPRHFLNVSPRWMKELQRDEKWAKRWLDRFEDIKSMSKPVGLQ